MQTGLGLLAVVLLITANAFFVAVEFALVTADRGRLEQHAAAGRRSAKHSMTLVKRLSFYLSGCQLGITVTSLVLGFTAEPTIGKLIEPLTEPIFGEGSTGVSVALALIIATFAQMILGELVPKSMAIANPVATSLRLATPYRAFVIVTSPFIRFLNGAADWVTRRVGVEPVQELHGAHSLDELRSIIRESGREGTLEADDVQLLTRTIRFGEKTAADALVPRVSMTAINEDETVAGLATLAIQTGLSRVPVIGEDLDDVKGVAHVKLIHGVDPTDRATTPVTNVMREIFAVPEGRDLQSLLVEMRERRTQIAVVVDEHGGTAGLVTVEDLVEEIVGEIDDEHDEHSDEHTPQADGSYLLPGSLHEDEVRDACGFEMPDGHYDTLAGYVLEELQRIPAEGEVLVRDGWRFEIIEMDGLRVATLQARPPTSPAAAGP